MLVGHMSWELLGLWFGFGTVSGINHLSSPLNLSRGLCDERVPTRHEWDDDVLLSPPVTPGAILCFRHHSG